MKTRQILKFSIVPPPIEFNLDIIEFDLSAVLGSGWKFAPEINGPAENDGVTGFQEAVLKASKLPKDQGCRLLFVTGIAAGNKLITGEDQIKVLSAVNFADPDLLWSLYKEDGQKTLRYLHDTYGVTWMESLRRILLGPGGGLDALYLNRNSDGSWNYNYNWIGNDRKIDNPALSLAILFISLPKHWGSFVLNNSAIINL